LEMTVTSVVNSLRFSTSQYPEDWLSALDRISRHSQRAYVELTSKAGFLDFFSAATPVDEIGKMQISSRPGRRGERRSISDLRAIPWSFGWTQCRALLPGWYGFGSAVLAESQSLPMLRNMVSQFPFFTTFLRNIERSLAIADISIFERYVRMLAPNYEQHGFTECIRAEYQRSTVALLSILNADRLLAQDPTLARSIALRNPYVDPISLLQLRLLSAYRSSECPDKSLVDAIRLSISGLAAGLRVTG
jgi:phosphoenolpyruvate carboxylase